jgi:CheY-like chemotaxis protein
MTTEPPLEFPRAQQARAPGDTYRILFLDSAGHVELLKTTCKDVGFVVVGAETIAEAMAFLEGKNHVDVIVCAAHLESESMFAFLRHVRAHPTHATSMFLILSLEAGALGTFIDRSAARAGVALGANAYAIMPTFDALALVAHIRELQPGIPTLLQVETPDEKLSRSRAATRDSVRLARARSEGERGEE